MKKVKLTSIRIDGGTQGRDLIDQETVHAYLECMKEGDEFPPLMTVYDGATHWLVDGYHRYHAYMMMGAKEVDVTWKPGTQDEAQVVSFGVNGKHGKPRTHADKRKVVMAALEHPMTASKSDREIAKICAVSHPFVASIRNPEVKEQQDKNLQKHVEKKRRGNISTQDEKSDKPDPRAGETPDDEELRAAEIAQQADVEAMYKMLESDDALKTAHDEIKRLNSQNAQLELRLHGLMTERNEAVKMVKKLQRELDKLKK